MHISDLRQSPNTILTKCSKMTEEKHKLHGINGSIDGSNKDEPFKTNDLQGGRLKFFKDGKFILELERAREGERVSWVSVPRKTFWPPQGVAASTPTYRQESSASLSDDNSSVQSSPWQRDHSWKQPSPRRYQSKEMSFYFWRPKSDRLNRPRLRRPRRPHFADLANEQVRVGCSERTVREQGPLENSKSKTVRTSLLVVVQNLLDKVSATRGADVVVVSPRKRFLREMEKDNRIQAEDNKRSRSKTAVQQNHVAKVASPACPNGTTDAAKPPSRNCSYSITSLLAEDRNVKRSPNSSPSHFSSTVTQPQYCSPSSEDRWYTESVDRLRSIELSQVDKRGYRLPYPHSSYLPHYAYPYTLPSYYSPGVYGRGYVMPPVYHAPQLPIGILRQDGPSCSWAADPPRNSEHKDDNITDMPLNLSKHAG